MPTFHPIQTAFNGGELSPRLRGRVDSPVYRVGLGFCENFRVLPQGPLLMRAGTLREGSEISLPRLIPFSVPGVKNDYVLAITPLKLRIYERGVGLVSIKTNLITNGHFDVNTNGWLHGGPLPWWKAPGVAYLAAGDGINSNTNTAPVSVGVSHTLRFKYRGKGTLKADVDFVNAHEYVATGAFQEASFNFIPGDVNPNISFAHKAGYAGDDYLEIDDVSLVSSADPGVTELTAPWAVSTLDLIRYAQSLVAAQMVFAHPAKMPRVLDRSAGDVWELREAQFTEPPSAWRDGAAPGAVEVGFQGRTWYGGTPNVPNGLWGSKSGQPFNFDLDDETADDALDLLISAKGTVRWVQGQKSLLIGTDATEHAVTGGDGGIITPGSYAVRDESAYGSADVQAIHIGDQVVFAAFDGRHLRAVNYDFQENGWVSKALTFLAEHITAGGIREIHFARSPDPTIIVVLYGGKVVACTYDRSQEVIAWYRLNFGAMVNSAAVAESVDGPELWLAVNRGGGYSIERMPLHETTEAFLDNAIVVSVAPNATVITGLSHLNGKYVTVARVYGVGLGGEVILTEALVASGQVTVPAEEFGATYVIGLPFTARAETLPLEGGNPAGTAQGLKRRFTEINLRLNNSALPKINGRRPSERSFGTNLDDPTALITDDVVVKNVEGWNDKAVVVIEQDLPLRTEVCALYGPVKVNL
jgi:hypothetical protein